MENHSHETNRRPKLLENKCLADLSIVSGLGGSILLWWDPVCRAIERIQDWEIATWILDRQSRIHVDICGPHFGVRRRDGFYRQTAYEFEL